MVGHLPCTRRRLLIGSTIAAAGIGIPHSKTHRALAHVSMIGTGSDASLDELTNLAADAYVFAYPLVLMDATQRQMTAVPAPAPTGSPVNQFTHAPAFPDPTFVSVASANVDTLYSAAWLDLNLEPMVLTVPDTDGRYYLMPLFDAWTNVFASPGARTTGTGPGRFAIAGPNWEGDLPEDVQLLRSPTEMVWLVGRTQTNGPQDYAFVHSLQAQYTLTPLSQWGMEYVPPIDAPVDPEADRATAPVDQVAAMSAQSFWTRFADLMVRNPPAGADAPMIDQLSRLAIVPGQPLAWAQLPSEVTDALEAGSIEGLQKIEAAGKNPGVEIANTWAMSYGLGSYGTEYLLRAGTAWLALGANLPEDAIYPSTRVDSTGQPLTGANSYRLRFEHEEIPPVEAFWSITMYDERQFLVPNPIGRYAIGDRDQLVFGADGSLELRIQHESPGAADESNWLPAPAEGFDLIMRLYWPKPEVLDGSWAPPALTRVT